MIQAPSPPSCPDLVPSATDDHHATFVIDGATGPVAVLDLLQGERHLELLHLAAPDLEHARALHDFAEAAARALRAREIRAPARRDERRAVAGAGLPQRDQARGARRRAAVARRRRPASRRSLYYRGIWAALALLTGLGSVSIAVFSGGGITLAHIVIPALLCIVGTLFALWQILLVVHGRPARLADRSSPCRPQSPRPRPC